MPKAALFAGDIMQTELVTIRPNDSVREAMALMVDSHVSGLPVVDGRGHCVGVLSVTDVLGLEYAQAESAGQFEEVGSYFDPDEQRWEHMRFAGAVDELPDLTVKEVMSSDIISVPRDASLQDVAQLMVERGVHRVLVLDERRFLHGLIAAMDVVRVVAES
jgi:CBS domain-containing protein